MVHGVYGSPLYWSPAPEVRPRTWTKLLLFTQTIGTDDVGRITWAIPKWARSHMSIRKRAVGYKWRCSIGASHANRKKWKRTWSRNIATIDRSRVVDQQVLSACHVLLRGVSLLFTRFGLKRAFKNASESVRPSADEIGKRDWRHSSRSIQHPSLACWCCISLQLSAQDGVPYKRWLHGWDICVLDGVSLLEIDFASNYFVTKAVWSARNEEPVYCSGHF